MVSPVRVKVAPAALKIPPPRPAPPAPPLPPKPPLPGLPATPVAPPEAKIEIPPAPLPPAPPIAWFEVTEVFVRLSDPAALKIPPPRAAPPGPPLTLPPKMTIAVPAVPTVPTATLLATTTPLSESRPPLLRIPPPSPTTRPCWIVTPVIVTLPPWTAMTRSRLLPSMIVWVAPRPWMETLASMSRSPLALPSPLAAGIVSVKFPAGRMILLFPPFASAAMMAERNETCPEASAPVLRLTATVSRSVFT